MIIYINYSLRLGKGIKNPVTNILGSYLLRGWCKRNAKMFKRHFKRYFKRIKNKPKI